MTVKTFPCWYCRKPMPMEGEVDHDYAFSREWDTPVHLSCIRTAIEKDPEDEEALIFARESLSFSDGQKFAKTLKDHNKKKRKDALDAACRMLSEMSPEEFAAVLEKSKNSDMLPFIREHVEATSAPYRAIKEAVQTINQVQNRLASFTTNSSEIFGPLREAFNLNARFLFNHPKEQNAYLESLQGQEKV